MKQLPRLEPAQFSIIGLTLLALALGGTTELWAQVVITGLAGILILVSPPKDWLGRFPTLIFVLLFLLSLTAYLPASLTPLPAWRQHLVDDFSVPLPVTRTAQPWLTLQACALFLVGLVWAYYVLSQKWDTDKRLQAARLLVLGIAILAAVAVAANRLAFHVPGWNQEQNRGWFPNRNQTADVLALAGIINYVLIFDRLRKGHRSGYFWLLTLAPILAALVISYSRAGILMFFGGIVLWHLWPTRHHKTNRTSIKWTALSLTLGFFLLALFFLFGGETLERFQSHTSVLMHEGGDFRLAIQQDALKFSFQQPILGVGLGNFGAIFATARQASINQEQAIHPESDWLWAACELGWFGPLLFFIAIIWWLGECFPFPAGRGESLRRAMAVATVLFLLHSIVDVSGHRVGSVWVALLLASMAMPSLVSVPVLHLGSLLFRVLALVLLLIAGWWWASLVDAQVPPTTATEVRVESRIRAAVLQGQVDAIKDLADDGLRIAPLNWSFYFQRAYAEAYQPGALKDAINDFQVARALEPIWEQHAIDEGRVWLGVNQPELCLDAWREALRRSSTKKDEHFNEMMEWGGSNPVVRQYLWELAMGHEDYLIIFLSHATPDEIKESISSLMASDPDLKSWTEDQRRQLFYQWWQNGDRADLTDRLIHHEDWQSAGWPYLAQSYAQQQDFQQAWQTVTRFSKPPVIPALASDQPLADLQRDFYNHPDSASGIMLYLADMKEGQVDQAMATLHDLEKIPDHPKYIYYLEAQLLAEKQQWQDAWNAWWTFYST